jgi:hypothetical protein
MADDVRFRLRLMRRRARLISRQIVVAASLTAAALGLVGAERTEPQQQVSSARR